VDDPLAPSRRVWDGAGTSHNLFLGGYCARLIENTCHWSLDVTDREDESRIREKHLRENFAWLNRLTLSLLKQHPRRDSLAMKRRGCGWSDGFLLEVLTGATP
jgi:hypothetical protein